MNGVRVNEQHVKPGDTLSFAKYAFEVFYDPAELGATDDAKSKLAETDVFSRAFSKPPDWSPAAGGNFLRQGSAGGRGFNRRSINGSVLLCMLEL